MHDRDIFLAALEIESPSERVAYVERACAGDAALRDRMEALLSFHEQEHSFLDTPCLENAAWADETAVGDEDGAVIGRYKILERIGEGGFAIVYMAEQSEPVRRKVALKVIKPGMDSAQVIGRFEAERQALALMDHPNIAKVFDGGVVDSASRAEPDPLADDAHQGPARLAGPTSARLAGPTGRPYFVMELVNGIPLTDFCDTYKLSTPERLEIFVQICRAVQHAHQKGVIHRDLKPSNILVTLHDDKPVPKVIDFGIAKATQQRLTERTVFTRFQHFIGTPAYMSPEQATFSGLDIDTRSDIYSLGVLLYELITGTTPFEKEKLREAAYDELCRMIRDDQPVTPSTRISTLGEQLRLIAQNRRTDPATLRQSVHGELDWIVMKALEKERSRRYETASAFATDVERFLNDEPVSAGPPSMAYRLRKLYQRNRRLAAGLAAVAAALVLGTIVSTAGLVAAVRAKNEAVDATADALDAKNRESDARQAAQREVERNRLLLHVSEVSNAQQAYRSGNIEYARQLLSRHDQPGENDLRTIPWYLMWEQCHQYKASLPHEAPLHALAYSPERQVLAAAGEGGLVTLWDVRTRSRRGTLHVEFETVASVAFSPDGTRLAVGGGHGFVTRDWPGHLEIWDWENRKRLTVLEPGMSMVACVAYSPDGTRLACGNYQGVLSVWDLTSPSAKPRWSDTEWANTELLEVAWCLTFSPQGSLLAGTSLGPNPLRLWDFEQDLPPQSVSIPAPVRAIAYSPDGRYLAIGLMDVHRPLLLKDLQSGEPDRYLVAEPCFAEAMEFSPDGRQLFTCNGKGSIEVYDVPSGERTAILKGHTSIITGLCLLDDARTLVSCGHDRTVKFWDVATTLPPETYTRGHDDFTPWMEFSRDGKLLATSSLAGDVRVWDVASARLKKVLLPQKGDATTVKSRRMAFSPDGTKLATADYDGTVTVHDLTSEQRNRPFDSGERPLSLEFSPDGERLVAIGYRPSAAAPGMYQVTRSTYDISSGELVGGKEVLAEINLVPQTMPTGFPPFRYEAPPMDDFARLSHSGRLLAYIYGNVVHLWDLETGVNQPLLANGHTEVIFNVAFSAGDDVLATCSQDKSIRLWDTKSGTLLKTLPARTWPLAVVFSRDGKTLFTSDIEANIVLWDLRTDKEILSLVAHEDIITALALSPDEQTLAAVSAPPSPTGLSGKITLWRAPRK